MSIVNALALFFAPDTSVASSKLEGWKAALSKKVDETSALVDDQFSSLLQRVDQTPSNLDQFNGLRREFKRKSANLFNYLTEQNEPLLSVNFQPVTSIDSGKLKQNIATVKSGLLKKLSKKLEALKTEIRNCRNVEELKVLINKVKTFRDGIKLILTEQIIITPAFAPQPAPVPTPQPQSSPSIVTKPTPVPAKPKPLESGIIITSDLSKFRLSPPSEGGKITGLRAEQKVQLPSKVKAVGIYSDNLEEKKRGLDQHFNTNFGNILNRKIKGSPVQEYSFSVHLDVEIKVLANGKATILKIKNKDIQLDDKGKKAKAFFDRAAEEAIKSIMIEIKNFKYKVYGFDKALNGKPLTISLNYSISS